MIQEPIVIDDVIDHHDCQKLLEQFGHSELGERVTLSTIMAPTSLSDLLENILQGCTEGRMPGVPSSTALQGPWLSEMPGRRAVGSSPMHQDNGFDEDGVPQPGVVPGCVAVLYLDGYGTLVLEAASKEYVVPIQPNRLVIWPNERCIHRVDASPDGGPRTMIGPMSLTAKGWRRAGDQYSVWYEMRESAKDAKEYEAKRKAEEESAKKIFAITAELIRGDDDNVVLTFTSLVGDEIKDRFPRPWTSQDLFNFVAYKTGLAKYQIVLTVGTDALKADTERICEKLYESKHAEAVQKMFADADKNNDGYLTMDELSHLVQKLGLSDSLSKSDLTKMFQGVDVDKNGRLDYKEFVQWVFASDALKVSDTSASSSS